MNVAAVNQYGHFERGSGVAVSKGVAATCCSSSVSISSSSLRSEVVVGRGVGFGSVMTIVVVGRQVVCIARLGVGMVEFDAAVSLGVEVGGVSRVVWNVVVELRALLVVLNSGAGRDESRTAPSMLPMSRAKLWGSASAPAVRNIQQASVRPSIVKAGVILNDCGRWLCSSECGKA